MTESRQNEMQKNIDDLHRSYGRFAVEFEHLCHSIRNCIRSAFSSESSLVDILLADQTASPLIAKLRSIIAIVYENEVETLKHLDRLFKYCIDLNEKRNEIIHGTWFIGWIINDDIDTGEAARGVKNKITKRGIELNSIKFKSSDFDNLTEKITVAKKLIDKLSACVTLNYPVVKNIDETELNKLKL